MVEKIEVEAILFELIDKKDEKIMGRHIIEVHLCKLFCMQFSTAVLTLKTLAPTEAETMGLGQPPLKFF